MAPPRRLTQRGPAVAPGSTGRALEVFLGAAIRGGGAPRKGAKLRSFSPTGRGRPAEPLRALTGLARGRFGVIGPERIARHVIAITPEGEWPLRKAARDALARRYNFAERDELRRAERPKASIFGIYRTKSASRGGGAPRGRI